MSIGSERTAGPTRSGRVRFRLLVLLWIWALCVFLVLDLFLNVKEFDTIRPHAALYRGMRVSAHKMVGEPIVEEGASLARLGPRAGPRLLGGDRLKGMSAERRLEIYDELVRNATSSENRRQRVQAIADLAEFYGPDGRECLVAIVWNDDEQGWVRGAAAQAIGRTEADAISELEKIVDSQLARGVKEAAIRGMAAIGTPDALSLVLAIAESPKFGQYQVAQRAIERFGKAENVALLAEIAAGQDAGVPTRVSACRALGSAATADAIAALGAIARDAGSPEPIRCAALESLERTGHRDALSHVAELTTDSSAPVAARARLAQGRLEQAIPARQTAGPVGGGLSKCK